MHRNATEHHGILLMEAYAPSNRSVYSVLNSAILNEASLVDFNEGEREGGGKQTDRETERNGVL